MFTSIILKMRKSPVKGVIVGLLIAGAAFLTSGCSEGGGASGNSVLVSDLGDQPTPVRFEGKSTPVLIPHTNLYIFLTASRPLYYRDGKYYQFYRENWYRSEDLNGPWEQTDETQIPDLLHNVPPDYYYENFPYQLQKEH